MPNGGNVGIGTSSPGYPLSVQGDCNITGAYRVNGTAISGGLTTQTQPGRALNTSYTNSTGKPVYVTMSASMAANSTMTATSNGVTVANSTSQNPAGQNITLFFIVLPGAAYQVTVSGATLLCWTEWY
jgi:beta-lactam-binding protein with PASTA domain